MHVNSPSRTELAGTGITAGAGPSYDSGSKMVGHNSTYPTVYAAIQAFSNANLPAATVSSMTALRLVSGAEDGQTIALSGYSSENDGGGGIFVWNSTSTVSDNGGTIIAPTGVSTGRWYRLFTGPIHSKWFGTKGDGVTDDYTPLQNAINYILANGVKLIIDAGTYSIGSPLIAYTQGQSGYVSVDIEGEGPPWYSAVSGPQTFIKPTFSNTFAIGIQNARAFKLKNLSIIGTNLNVFNNATVSDGWAYLWTESNYVGSGVRDSRYSPYSGIAIDPFQTTVPSDGGYPGLSSWYGASIAASSGGVIENVTCTGFVCGAIIGPASSGNDSEICFRDCTMSYNKVGVATTQPQSRNYIWLNGSCNFNLIQFDGLTYGSQQGVPPSIFGCNMAGKYLFNCYKSGGQAAVLSGIHAESFLSIGMFGPFAAVSSAPIEFNGCDFNFTTFGTNGIYIPEYHLASNCPLKFTSCHFTAPASLAGTTNECMLRFIVEDYSRTPTFDACFFSSQSSTASTFPVYTSDTGGGLSFKILNFCRSAYNNNNTNAPTVGVSVLDTNMYYDSIPDRNVVLPGSNLTIASNSTNILYHESSDNYYSLTNELGTSVAITNTNGTVTFTEPTSGTVVAGDILLVYGSLTGEATPTTNIARYWTFAGVVTSVSSGTVTVYGAPVSLVSGNYAIYTLRIPLLHQASTGTTASSTSITSVTNPTTWTVGCQIKGSGIPAGTYVTNVSGTTLTISQAATSSASGVRLYDANLYSVNTTVV